MKKQTSEDRILLVDDSAVVHKIVLHSLAGRAQLTSAFTLQEARNLLTQNFDLLLLDVQLPERYSPSSFDPINRSTS